MTSHTVTCITCATDSNFGTWKASFKYSRRVLPVAVSFSAFSVTHTFNQSERIENTLVRKKQCLSVFFDQVFIEVADMSVYESFANETHDEYGQDLLLGIAFLSVSL